MNEASSKYYNGIESGMLDAEWDAKLSELQKLENETGFSLPDSPTKKVGAPILDGIKKVKINIPMLSLDKCHSAEEIIKFANNEPVIASVKLDGLSVRIIYKDGKLFSANTRGTGIEGSDISEHIKYFDNVPTKIEQTGTYIIDGEAIISTSDFEKINQKLPENDRYANQRNLAAGSLGLLDMNIVKERHLKFIAWDVIEGEETNSLYSRLGRADKLGFETVDRSLGCATDDGNIMETINHMLGISEIKGYPCDGVVFKFDDVAYGKSLGKTSHHFNNGIAWKPARNIVKTKVKDVEWSMGKTGDLTPVLVVEPVLIDGTIVERCSLHNITIAKQLGVRNIGQTAYIYKANLIIPQLDHCDDDCREGCVISVPSVCPVCGGAAHIIKENDTEVLRCVNPDCPGKLLGRLKHFVSKNAINIDGISEATLQFLIDKGWVTNFIDLFNLSQYEQEWSSCEGFGKKSVSKILENIEKSKNTELWRFIYSLSISLIGKSASKIIEKAVSKQSIVPHEESPYLGFRECIQYGYNWKSIPDFGDKMAVSLQRYCDEHMQEIDELAGCFNFVYPKQTIGSAKNEKIANKIYVITGKLSHFKNRNELVNIIEKNGGKVSGSVSAKTSYLINNDINSTSGKNKKAKDLNIPIISEDDFLKFLS